MTKHSMIDLLIKKHLKTHTRKKICIREVSGRDLSYEDLAILINIIPSCFSKLNKLKKGDVVSLVFDDSIESIAVFFAIINLGLIPVYLNPNIPDKSIQYYINASNSKCIIIDEKYLNKFDNELIKNNNDFILFNLDIEKIIFENRGNSVFQYEHYPQEKEEFCLFTSGTSGEPCAVIHKNLDVILMCENYGKEILTIKEYDIFFSTSRMYFAYGLNAIFLSLYHGSTVIISDIINKTFEENIKISFEKFSPTIFFSVPYFYNKLLLSNLFSSINLKNVKYFVSAGENLNKFIFQSFKEKYDVEIIDGIGSTETLTTFISNIPGQCKSGSTGKIVPGFKTIIKDINGENLEDGSIGVLWLSGDTYPNEYVNNDKLSKQRFVDGWFKTNDLFSLDKEGYYYYHGRASDVFYKNGVWVYTPKIENKILLNKNINECSVLKYKTKEEDIYTVAFVVLSKNICIDEFNQLALHLNKYDILSKEENVDLFFFIDELPRTPSGKILKNNLLDIIDDEYSDINFPKNRDFYVVINKDIMYVKV